jgi:hypothetical protein
MNRRSLRWNFDAGREDSTAPAHLTGWVAVRTIAMAITPMATSQSHRREFTSRSDTSRMDTAVRCSVMPLQKGAPVTKTRIQLLEFRNHHISNAGTRGENLGVNSAMVGGGVHWLLR